jgi:hypothetical protein
MHVTTVGVDLAKNHFELAVADEQFCIRRRERLARSRFSRLPLCSKRSALVLARGVHTGHYELVDRLRKTMLVFYSMKSSTKRLKTVRLGSTAG